MNTEIWVKEHGDEWTISYEPVDLRLSHSHRFAICIIYINTAYESNVTSIVM